MGDDALMAGEIGRSLHRIEDAVRGVQVDVRGLLGRIASADVQLEYHADRIAKLEGWQSRTMWTLVSIGLTAAGALITAAIGVILGR